MTDIAKTLAEVKTEIERIGGDVKNVAEDALKQAKANSELTASVKKEADDLLQKQGELVKQQSEMEARQLDLEQKLASSKTGASNTPQSVGQILAQSDEFKAYQANPKGSFRHSVQNAITSVTPGAGGLIWSDRESDVVALPRRPLRIRQLLGQNSTASNLVEYAKQTLRDNKAAMVAETAQKPESNYQWDKADAPVRTIAHFAHISRQAIDDAAMLQGEIDGELRYGLDLEEENQLLAGDGVGENLSGLITEATAYSAPFAVTGETPVDTLRLAILQASLAEYPADGIVLHPTDWAKILLTKDANGNYIVGGPQSPVGPSLWSVPVVASKSITAGNFLAGAFRTAATIYDRMDVEVLISSEDRDNFIKNMYTMRAEKRLALAVKRPAALTYGAFPVPV